MASLATSDRLAVTLTVTIGGKDFKIAGGDVKSIALNLWSWGHEGHLEFFVQDNKILGGKEADKLVAAFLKPDLIELTLTVAAVLSDQKKAPTIKPITVKGYVIDKSLVETTTDNKLGAAIQLRRYGVHFVDAAQLLWRQHFPCELYTKKTLKDVYSAHKGDKITLKYDWAAVLEAAHPMIFIGLDPVGGASFYDFTMWLVREYGGVFVYDYTKQSYEFKAAKDTSAATVKIFERDINAVEFVFPEIIRHDVNILNGYTEAPTNKPVTQKQAVTGIRRDLLMCTPISDEATKRGDLEKAKLVPRGAEVEVSWLHFPIAPFTPNSLIEFQEAPRFTGAGLPIAKQVYRVKHLRLHADAVEQRADYDHLATDSEYRFQMNTRLELKAEHYVDLPEFTAPRYPHYVEGKIVSEVGDKKDETWQTGTDGQTSLDKYKVKIPLWANQIITVPFNPNLLPGHFYFPAYKDERVLIALDFLQAWLKRFLDWRAGARMPSDGQGVHLLVGKTTKSGTSMKHDYQDGNPVFQLKRTHDKDNAQIQIKEGNLLILVKEDK